MISASENRSVILSIPVGLTILPAVAECPARKDGDECEKVIHRSFSVGGFASAGFAKAVKMHRAEARGASPFKWANALFFWHYPQIFSFSLYH